MRWKQWLVASSAIGVATACFLWGPVGSANQVKVSGSRFHVTSAREGQLTIFGADPNKALQVVQMPEKRPVRGMFLLNGETVLAASQLNGASIYSLPGGTLVQRLPYDIVSFSPSQKRYLAGRYDGAPQLTVYSYPGHARQFTLPPVQNMGAAAVRFSPNDRYLVVQFDRRYPVSDETYPNPRPAFRNVPVLMLYDLQTQSVVAEFNRGQTAPVVALPGEFSPDSRYYVVTQNGAAILRFDTQKNAWEVP